MKTGFRAMALAMTLFGSVSAAQAGMITGSQGLAVLTSINAGGGNVATASTFSNLNFTTTGAQSGDYLSVGPGITFAGVTLDINNLATFTFGNGTFGTFTADTIVDGGFDAVTKTRSFLITGEFDPGTLFPSLTTNTAVVSISFTQVGGSGQPISLSGTLITPAPTPTPEPSTIVLLGTVCGPLAFGAYRRRRTQVGA